MEISILQIPMEQIIENVYGKNQLNIFHGTNQEIGPWKS